ncbi:hypothetical protein GOP47_0014358 [Adiantum capillus-veneris]|uniref:Myb/SANT-like DNA-binding domain-containing protein n=1 Tax=Adiantum capillus-veneris TaxID=13818 RepID=A0A9D4ZE31_ADICA|nr:hypothetical protein GOP47_0014358 [Adiantum capillus-veneris]
MVSPIATSESCLPVKSISLEGGMLGGTIMPATSTGRLELNRPFHDTPGGLHYFGQTVPPHLLSSCSWPTNQLLNENQAVCAKSIDYHGNIQSAFLLSKGKFSATSDEDESSSKEATDEHNCEKGKRTSPWQRIKWTNDMIKVLINIVNYVGEDGICDNLDINKRSILQKKGKWRSVSNAMNERGWYVSPQQCEDKFNDLNKRYKRLTDILGRHTALQVVDDISLLDNMTNLSVKRKEDVKKILSSKHSFYKEMHSYHSGVKSPMIVDLRTHSAKVREACDAGMGIARSVLVENGGMHTDVKADMESSLYNHACNTMDGALKRVPSFREGCSKHPDDNHGALCHSDTTVSPDAPCSLQGEACSGLELTDLRRRLMNLEELKVGLQAQALELGLQRHRWRKLNCKQNDELERLREDNKRMKKENDQLTYQLKQKELEVECKRSVTSMALFDLVLEKLRAKEQQETMQAKYG